MKTHQAIDLRIKELEEQITKLKIRKANTYDEECVQTCPRCKTINYHYNVKSGHFTCAFC